MEPLLYRQEKSIGSSLDKVHTSEVSGVSGWGAAWDGVCTQPLCSACISKASHTGQQWPLLPPELQKQHCS